MTVNPRSLLEKFSNVIAAILYALLAWRLGLDWQQHGRFSSLLFLAQETLFIVFFLIRSMPKEVSNKPYDWFVAFATTCLPFFMRPGDTMADLSVLLFLQLCGIFVSIIGTLSLNRSLGIVPANRGVKREGLYRYVRHPIYAGYTVTYLMFITQNPTSANIAVFAAFTIFMILRIHAEERLLGRDPIYAEYMTQTRWRLLPGVF